MNIFKKVTFGALLFMQYSCLPRIGNCPDETTLHINFHKPDGISWDCFGNKIDTVAFTIYGLKNGRKYPFSSLPNLPVDVSTNEMTYIFERPNRKDTLVIQYDLKRASCKHRNDKNSVDGLYLRTENYSFIKNTFNESDTTFHCSLSANFLYE